MDFGIFNDEGLVEYDFDSKEAADTTLATYGDDHGCWVSECCHDHPEHEKDSCEECNAEDDSDEDE